MGGSFWENLGKSRPFASCAVLEMLVFLFSWWALGALAVVCVSVVISNNLHPRPDRQAVPVVLGDLEWDELAVIINRSKLARRKRLARACINDGDGLNYALLTLRSIDF